MSEGRRDRAALGHKTADIAVAALFLLMGGIVVVDSLRLGSSWGDDGPRPGYFPFYVGLIICLAAVVNAVRAFLVDKAKARSFVDVGQLKLVLSVLVPSALYAAAVTWIGIYVASVLFIAYFMRRLGKYAWWKVAAVSLGVIVAIYLVFEIWFLVPLPKGPVESLLGLG